MSKFTRRKFKWGAHWLVGGCLAALAAPAWADPADTIESRGDSSRRGVVKVSFHGDEEGAPAARPVAALEAASSGEFILHHNHHRTGAMGGYDAYDMSAIAHQHGHGHGGGACGYGDCGYQLDPGGFWVKADYLNWTMTGNHLPPLVTTSPVGTPQANAGVLPNATVLFGDRQVDDGWRSGARIRFGLWLDDCQMRGVEAHFFGFGQASTTFTAASDGNPILARPFFNVDPQVNGQDALLVAFDFPNGDPLVEGSIDVSTSSNVYSAGALFRQVLKQEWGHRVDFLVGYRFFRLDEGLVISDTETAMTNTGQVMGTTFENFDLFDADNQFHGVDVGISFERQYQRFAIEGLVKCALGVNREKVVINGQSTVTVPNNPPQVTPAGLLAQSTNIGQYSENNFAVLPEASVTLSYFVSDRIKLSAGYSVLYLSHVVRSGDQIDFSVNGTLLEGPFAGPERPAFQMHAGDIFLHGVHGGLEIMF